MMKQMAIAAIIPIFLMGACKDKVQNQSEAAAPQNSKKDSIEVVTDTVEAKAFQLDEENAIPFFFDYQKGLKENIVEITTNLGSFTIQLYDNVPYHKANFIYLTRKGYFDHTQFHRVVKNFIIQGGNSDDVQTAKKRSEIGRYLLPPDTRKGYRHDRGTVSMPSSEINNPHMLASPFEFFIVVTNPGSYHLDGDYTPFGKVIDGMEVVDKINQQPVGKGDWPFQNIYIEKAEVIE